MSGKLSSSNSLKLSNCDHQWSSVKSASIDTNVKLAGDEAKDRLYEPKHKKKLVRVLTVVAYVFFVSLAAIMLSLYYIFLWKPDESNKQRSSMMYAPDNGMARCNNGNYLVNIAEPTAIPVVEKNIDELAPTPSIPISYEESQQGGDKEATWPEVQLPVNTTANNPIRTIAQNSHTSFMRKLFATT